MAWINVDYDFYTNTFKGTVIPESAFDRKSVESEAFINKITFGRIHKYDLRPDDLKAVKLSICAAAEAVYNLDKHRDIKSENNDGYSVTYADSGESSRRLRMIEAADIYLADTTLRNRMASYDY